MSPEIRCPSCGEAEAIRGERDGERILLRCERCDHTWDRDTRPACPTCGTHDLRAVPKAVMEKSRGTSRSIVGTVTVHLCPTCDRDQWERYQQTRSPLPPD